MAGIPNGEVSNRLAVDNPWWQAPESGDPAGELPRRAYFPAFFRLASDRSTQRAVVLMGPRRVGKTVMLRQAIDRLLREGFPARQIFHASVDAPLYTGLHLERLLSMAAADHGLRLDRPAQVFFDEVQYLKDWERHLKSLVDTYPAVKFTVSGSSAAALRLKSSESGAGRFTDFLLPPLSFSEYLAFIGEEEHLVAPARKPGECAATPDIEALNRHFLDYINYGGYPESVFAETVRRDPARFIRSDIIDKVLLRDLPSLYGIHDIQELNRLFMSLAYQTGQEVSPEGLASASGVAQKTIRKYLEYLEAAFLIGKLRRVDDTCRTFQRERAFKVYLTNPSMRAALFAPVAADDAERLGPLVETAVLGQWFHSRDILREIHYARWKKGEVDVVHLDAALQPDWALEIKWSDRAVQDHSGLHGLRALHAKKPFASAVVTTRTETAQARIGGLPVDFVPAALYCYSVGKNVINRI